MNLLGILGLGAVAYYVTKHWPKPHDHGPAAKRKRRAKMRNRYRRLLRSSKFRGAEDRRFFRLMMKRWK